MPLSIRPLLAKFAVLHLIMIYVLFPAALAQQTASQSEQSAQLEAQRKTYQALVKRIRNTSSRQLNTLVDDIEAMRDYPLFPYLYYELVNRNITYSNRKQIDAFLNDVNDIPIRNKLLKKWLTYLAKNNYKTLFLATYEGGLGTELLCRNLHIRRVKGQLDESWHQQVEVIWLAGYSLPDACDPVLLYWRQQGKLKPELAISRMSLAGAAGQRSLSGYLKRFAPDDAHYIADLWSQVRRNPSLALRPGRFPFRYPEQDSAIVEWGLNRMSWRSPTRVIEALPNWEQSGKLSARALQSVKETLAISLTLDNHDRAREWLMKAATQDASNSLWRWYLVHSVREQQWPQVIDIVKTAPPRHRNTSEFQYWYARALIETGDTEVGNQRFQSLATQRHYYGFMAAAHINQSPQFNVKPLQADITHIQFVKSHAQALRARELFALKDYVNARREWFAFMKKLSLPQQQAAVLMANNWQWHDQAIVGALKVKANDDLLIRFPPAYTREFETQSDYYQIDPSFALAIARRESSFMEDAISSANARGIMQVLPDTARYLLNKSGVLRGSFKRNMSKSSINRELAQAPSNIEFGVGFLRYLQQKLGDDPVIIAAAYNAGWRKVEKWMPVDKAIPVDIWIDAIPFKETREYVKAILAYQLIYDWHRKQPLTQFEALASRHIMPPST